MVKETADIQQQQASSSLRGKLTKKMGFKLFSEMNPLGRYEIKKSVGEAMTKASKMGGAVVGEKAGQMIGATLGPAGMFIGGIIGKEAGGFIAKQLAKKAGPSSDMKARRPSGPGG